jgi:RNA polymerase sigma-70 factor (ECF subfamily)
MTDTHQLIAQASRGDAAAIEQLLEQNLPDLQHFIRVRAGRLLLAKEESSDLVQSTCREILQHLDRFQYENEEAFKKWLHTTALRKILDRARYYQAEKRDAGREVRPRRKSPSQSGEGQLLEAYQTFATPSRSAMSREELERVQVAFEQLPDDYREVIILARVVGLPHAEIAEKMNRSQGAVRVLLSRALARLATLVDPDEPGGDEASSSPGRTVD